MFLAIILFLIVFTVVVLVHELGHFISARYLKIAVDEFSIGLPPRIWQRKRKELTLSLGLIPIGGFVRLRDEGEKKDPRAFANKPPLSKIILAASGSVMNLGLALVLFLFGFLLGMPPLYSDIQTLPTASSEAERVQVIAVGKNSPAEKAGIRGGDFLLTINQEEIKEPRRVVEITAGSLGQELSLTLVRGNQSLLLKAKPEPWEGRGSSLGIVIEQAVQKAHYAWWATPYLALLETSRVTGAIALGLVRVVSTALTQGQIGAELTGPVGIARLTGEAASLGLFKFLHFVILLTINLAILNLLPLPALDGGRLVIALGEGLFRRRLKREVENLIHLVGFLLLLTLIIFVTYRDIVGIVK